MNARNLNAWSEARNLDSRWTGRYVGAPNPWVRRAIQALGLLRLWVRRSRQRAELRATLAREPRFFSDIGVSRGTVYKEASKWFWQS